MATLQGQEIKDTYQALLKTDNNTTASADLQTITDGQGNATALLLSTNQLYVSGTISNSVNDIRTAYINGGGTSGSQYFVYNSANRSIYLNAYEGWYDFEITSSLASVFTPGKEILFVHTVLGPLTGSVESSYFYNGEGDPLTIIKLTTDPSNGTNDTYNGPIEFPAVFSDPSAYATTLGYKTYAIPYAHAEGMYNSALGDYSHAEGLYTTALGIGTHTEGVGTTTIGNDSHAEGYYTIAIGQGSHAEGGFNTAVGWTSHAEGYYSTAVGDHSHAEGNSRAVGTISHGEGNSGLAVGRASHAEGTGATSVGDYSHSEGQNNTSIGQSSHAEGSITTAKGIASHAEGWGTISSGSYNGFFSGTPQHAEGRWNIPDTTSLLIVGNGTADNARKNAFAITTFITSSITASTAVFQQVSESLNYTNDAAAAAGGVPLGGIYRSGSFVLIRMT